MSDILLPLHLISLFYALVSVVRADHLGLLWIRGKVDTLDAKKIDSLHRHSFIGLSLMIVTGFFLFLPMREYLLSQPQFFVKMVFVVTLIVNGFIIGTLKNIASTRKFSSLSTREKLPLFISGFVSTISWLGAILGGFYLIP